MTNIILKFILPLTLLFISGYISIMLDSYALNLFNNNLYFIILLRTAVSTIFSLQVYNYYGINNLNSIKFIPGITGLLFIILSGISSYISFYFYYLLLKNWNF